MGLVSCVVLHLGGTQFERGVQVYWCDRRGRRHLENLGIYLMKLLKLIFKK